MPLTRRPPTRLLILYFLDWLVILVIIAIAGSSSLWVTPNARPFSPTDPSLSFPYQTAPKIPTWLLLVCAVIIPATIIFVLSLLSPVITSNSSARVWVYHLYSLNTAWLGLALSVTAAMAVTDGLKNVVGRPRPDLIARCGNEEAREFRQCTTEDRSKLEDGFRSFPSGHSSTSFAGLTYLTLFLAERIFALRRVGGGVKDRINRIATIGESGGVDRGMRGAEKGGSLQVPRMLALLICAIPLLAAAYISATRYSDFRHHPGDILFGAALGVVAAAGGWRLYGVWCCQEDSEGGVYGGWKEKTGGREAERGV